MRMKKRYLLGVMVMALGALIPSPAAATGTYTQVASGLDSPRGIAFYNGRMVVAEAGHGGPNCFTPPGAPPGFQACVGDTSRISWVNTSTGIATPLVTGLFSISLGPEGTEGVSGISVSEGRILGIMGIAPQLLPPGAAFDLARAQAGHLISVKSDGKWRSVASVGEADFNYTKQFTEPTQGVYSPGTQENDANPYGVLATDDGTYVADAGSNTLDFVNEDGEISILHHFEWRDSNPNNFPSDAVPTCVARSDDALWVGQLSGRLTRIDDAGVTEVTPKDSAGKPLLTHVTGCTSDQHGNLYFVNMFGTGIPFGEPSWFNGTVVRYGAEDGKASVLVDHLFTPNMPAIGPDGNLYVTAGSVCPASGVGGPPPCTGRSGTVLRINLPHGDDNNQD